MASRGSSYMALFLLLLVLGQGAYIGIGLYLTPQVAGITPGTAKAGDVVTIRGANFAPYAWDNVVLFGNQSARVRKANPGVLEAEVPALVGLGAGPSKTSVRVVVGSRVSSPFEMGLIVAVVAEASPEPVPPATPAPSPVAASPSPEPTGHPEPRPKSVPPTIPPMPSAAEFLAEAATAESARRYDDAVALYDKALALEPQNAKAQAGQKAAQANAAALKKTFQPGQTQVEGPVQSRGNFKDFDTREVAIHKAPEVPARLDFEISPARLVAGDAYAVKVYLQNEGAKPIKIASMKVTSTVNGSASGGAVPTKVGELAPKGRVLIHEAQGVWKDGTTSWILDVQVTSSKGDSYHSLAVWK
jgi:IPT/TIG domain-containing protein